MAEGEGHLISKGYKGGDFERTVAKQLSLWWSKGLGGEVRDDIFWRTSQSGGRATQRFKSGKNTYGSQGDIASVDPVGEPLIKLFTIELKRGSSHGSPGDLLDFKADNLAHPWMKCLIQTIRSHKQAKSPGWMMVCRRDHRQAVACIASSVYRHFTQRDQICPRARFILPIGDDREDFVVVLLEDFLSTVTPKEIIRVLEHLT